MLSTMSGSPSTMAIPFRPSSWRRHCSGPGEYSPARCRELLHGLLRCVNGLCLKQVSLVLLVSLCTCSSTVCIVHVQYTVLHYYKGGIKTIEDLLHVF